MRFVDLLQEPDFEVYENGTWVQDLWLRHRAELQVETLAEEES